MCQSELRKIRIGTAPGRFCGYRWSPLPQGPGATPKTLPRSMGHQCLLEENVCGGGGGELSKVLRGRGRGLCLWHWEPLPVTSSIGLCRDVVHWCLPEAKSDLRGGGPFAVPLSPGTDSVSSSVLMHRTPCPRLLHRLFHTENVNLARASVHHSHHLILNVVLC